MLSNVAEFDSRVNIGLKTRLIVLLLDVDRKIYGPLPTNASVRASQISVTHSHSLFLTQS